MVSSTAVEGDTAIEFIGADEPVKYDKTFSSVDSLLRYLDKSVDFCHRPLEE